MSAVTAASCPATNEFGTLWLRMLRSSYAGSEVRGRLYGVAGERGKLLQVRPFPRRVDSLLLFDPGSTDGVIAYRQVAFLVPAMGRRGPAPRRRSARAASLPVGAPYEPHPTGQAGSGNAENSKRQAVDCGTDRSGRFVAPPPCLLPRFERASSAGSGRSRSSASSGIAGAGDDASPDTWSSDGAAARS